MIGRRDVPTSYYEWNRQWGAPVGRTIRHVLRSPRARRVFARFVGPFGFQPDNNATRIFEYPWAFFATPLRPGMRAVELGGSLSGFQFVLSRVGLDVVNVDPGTEATMGWPVSHRQVRSLNRAFRTNVKLHLGFLTDAGFPDETVDRVFSLSVLEHIPPRELPPLLREVQRILVPGGLAVFTVDLFVNLAPFTTRTESEAGRNLDVRWLVESSGLELVQGDPSELNGYPEFDPSTILENLPNYRFGSVHPAVSQAFVLQKTSR